jgi:CTP:molybdopterin cytidylyltransferase MocA
MKATPSRPVRASATALANKAGCLTLTIKRPELVPGTLKALAEVSESAEAYAASSASGARGWS